MPQIPRRTKSSKVGSNLKNAAALHSRRTKALKARAAKYRKAQTAFRRERGAILTKPIGRKMTPVVKAIRLDYAKTALLAGGDPAKLRAARVRAQEAMAAALTNGVPRFAELQRLATAYSKTYGTLVTQDAIAASRELLPVTLGDVGKFGPLPQTFRSYTLFDVFLFDYDNYLIFNESFVEPGSGTLVTNFHFDQNEDRFNAYYPNRPMEQRLSVGVNVTIPQTGFITVSAVMENLFNKITMAIEDNFGFSHDFLDVEVSIFMSVVRSSGAATDVSRIMLRQGIQEFGDSFSFVAAPIPDQVPFTLTFEPHDAFLKGETIQVIVGTKFAIDNDVDDMESFVNALLVWHVKKIVVSMKP